MKAMIAAAMSVALASAAQATTVFINEIHYDNTGGDTGEFVEIAAPAGTDLTGWSIVFYNGSNGTTYGTQALSGAIGDQAAGYGFATVNRSGIQNGSPDGLALVDATGNVVQFLSYEGQLTATNGIASGLTSMDIGVSEPGSTAIGDSLQLSGSGTAYADFVWQAPATATPGAANNNQAFGGVVVDNAPTVVSTDPADGDANVAIDASISIRFSEDVAISAINAIECTSEVAIQGTLSGEGATYTVDPDTDFTSADECSFTISAEDVTDLDGEPDTMAEDVTIAFSVVDESATASLLVNEIHADPASGDAGDANGDGTRNSSGDEFVEIVNNGEQAFDLTGWELSDGVQVRHVFPSGSTVEAGCAVVVFGDTASTDGFGGALVQAASTGAVGLNNGGDTITLTNGAIIIEQTYGSAGGDNQSLTRDPDITGEVFVKHSVATGSEGALYSPGTQVNGNNFAGCTVPDVAPTVVDVTPADQATLISVDTAVIVTFSEDVSLGDLPSLNCSVSGEVSLGSQLNGAVLTLTPEAQLADGETCNLLVSADQVSDVDGQADALAADFVSSFTTAEALSCDSNSTFTPIATIQGSGSESPISGQDVLVKAVVTSVLPELNGFVVQQLAADEDGNPETSEGIYVQNTNFAVPSVGELVLVNGSVSERFGRTQLSLLAETTSCEEEVAAITPTSLSLPVESLTELESLEGMLVNFSAPLTVSDNFGLGRFGRVTLSNGRIFNPNNIFEPGTAENLELAEQNQLNRIILDDGSDNQNPAVVPFPTGNLSASNTLRLGDTVSSLTGVLDFTRGEYMIYATAEPTFVASNPRTEAPDLAPGNLSVASLNVLNFFNNIDSGPDICGPEGNDDCRGADDNGTDSAGRTEFERQTLKTVAAIASMNADIVGLMEIENNGFGEGSAIAELVDAVNAELGEDAYAIVDPGTTVGTDAITVALIYKPDVVSLSGALRILDSSNSISDEDGPLFNDRRNRPSLIQKFALNANGEEVVVSVNHLKSKGSSCGAGDDDNETGQGSCNLTRTRAAQALTAFIANEFVDTPALIIGDLNAYAKEDPIRAILAEGYTDLANEFGGASAYSYTFGGELGYLDHALANDILIDSVVDTTEWHINADEPIVLDYNLNFKSASQIDSWYAPDAYRMSDHDPVIVSLKLEAQALRGDWDKDGDVDINDVRGFMMAIRTRQSISDDFDLNKDGKFNIIDVQTMMTLCSRTRCAA
ncbi:ExeM/NucH family extracellular endonuclease [Alteromonas sp. P256]|uniref:ExeM/NucH family extracellular endonuclease n=1 Tax=Alteromonas sp. P256 TaxID=3117399 RepID=UPI002FE11DFA